jgi:hypothetical protein
MNRAGDKTKNRAGDKTKRSQAILCVVLQDEAVFFAPPCACYDGVRREPKGCCRFHSILALGHGRSLVWYDVKLFPQKG